MATVKTTLRKDKKLKGNKYPFVVMVGSQQVKKYRTIDHATEEQFDKRTGLLKGNHPNYIKSNRAATKLASGIQDKIYESILNNTILTVDDLLPDKDEQEVITSYDFFTLAEELRKDYLSKGKQGTYLQWGGVVAKLKKYNSDKPLPLSAISKEFLLEYKNYLSRSVAQKGLGNKPNTIWSNFKVLRAVYKQALNRSLVTGVNPFTLIETKTEAPMKERMNLDDFRAFENDTPPSGIQTLAHRAFIFAFYCWGMRFRDVALLKPENINGKRLSYLTSKSNFTKRMTLVLNDKSLSIINEFKNNGTPYLFPLLKEEWSNPVFEDITEQSEYLIRYEHAIASINESVNKALKQIAIRAKIGINLSFHTARHSFIDILKKKNMSIEMRMQLVGHTSEAVHKRYHGDFDFEDMSDLVNEKLTQ